MDLKKVIRSVPDFPEKGILFYDITTILQSPEALRYSVDELMKKLDGVDFDVIVGPESRGFIFGVPIAYNMNKGFVPVRKAGKLPYTTVKKSYSLEYGQAAIEMHIDAIKPGQRVVVVDDLLATGGTSRALLQLIEEVGGVVEAVVFLVELEFLNGRAMLEGYNVHSILKYDA